MHSRLRALALASIASSIALLSLPACDELTSVIDAPETPPSPSRAAAATETASTVEPAEPVADTPQAGELALPDGSHEAIAAAQTIELPPDWSGTGVLEKRKQKLPRRAPAWAKITAEVVERDGQRFLVTSGHAGKIRDAHLARSTAEARARAELARWTRTEKLVGSVVVDAWRDPRSGDAFARAELPVPNSWQPGQPLR